MKLTNKQQIEVLESVLGMLLDGGFGKRSGLCILVLYELSKRGYCNYNQTNLDEIRLFVPLLTIENAAIFGADINSRSYWWPLSDIGIRAKFLKWTIKQLKLNSDETTKN